MSVLGLDVSWQVGGQESDSLDSVTLAFEQAGAELAQFGRYAFPKIQPVFETQVKKQFDAEGKGPLAGAWAQLSQKYEAWKAGVYPGQPILRATGALEAGLTEDSSPFAERSYSDSQFNFGTSGVPYASFHQTGTAKMPARPPFDFTEELETELLRASMEGVREAIENAGLGEAIQGGA